MARRVLGDRGGPRGGRGYEEAGEGKRFISSAGRQSGLERGTGISRHNRRRQRNSPPKPARRAATAAAAATTGMCHPSFDGNPTAIKGGIYVHGWQPRSPFLTCSERSLRSRPPELSRHGDPVLPSNSQRPAVLLGSFACRGFQLPAPTHSVAGNSAKQHTVGGSHHHRYLQQQQQQQQGGGEMLKVCSNSGSEMFARETPNVHAMGMPSTPTRSIGGYAQEDVDTAVDPTRSMVTLPTGSEAVCCTATTAVTQQNPPSDKTSAGRERLSAVSTWWAAFIEQAIVFACADRAHNVDGRDDRRVETCIAALLAETFMETACQNVHGHGLEARPRQSTGAAQRIPSTDTDALAVATTFGSNSHSSDEGGEEEAPVLSQGAPGDPAAIGVSWRCLSLGSFAREFVAEVMREGFLEAVPMAVAAAQRPTVPLATVEDQEEPPSAVQGATSTAVDGKSRLSEKGVEEEHHHHHQQKQQQQSHQQQPAEIHDESGDRAAVSRCSDVSTRISSPAPGAVTATRVPSPTPPTTTTGGGVADTTHPSGLQVVRLPTAAATDVAAAVEQPAHSSSAAAAAAAAVTSSSSAAAAATINPEDRRRTPPFSRKRLRSGTFVRITNVPVKNNIGVGHSAQLDAAGSKAEARTGARCWRPRQISQQSSRHEAAATAAVERRRRPRTAVVLQEAVGIDGGRVRPVASRPPDVAVKREAKSAGAARSAAGVGVEARNRSTGGVRVQLRRNRWCSPPVVDDGGSLGLEGSVTSLVTTPSCSSRERLPCPAVDGDTQKVSIADAAAPRRPPPSGQAHHIPNADGRAGSGAVAVNSIEDGDVSGATRTIYGVAIGGEGGEAAKQAAGEEELGSSPTKSSAERVYPPMSYRYKNHVQAGSAHQGLTAISAAARVADRSEREGLFWLNHSNGSRIGGAQSGGGSVIWTEYGTRGSGGRAESGKTGGWKVAPPRKPPTGIEQLPRPGRIFTRRA